MTDVSRNVKQEREPADPIEELDFADFTDLGWKLAHGSVHLLEDGNNTTLAVWGRSIDSRVTFGDVDRGDEHSTSQCYAGDHAEDLKLRVAEEGH